MLIGRCLMYSLWNEKYHSRWLIFCRVFVVPLWQWNSPVLGRQRRTCWMMQGHRGAPTFLKFRWLVRVQPASPLYSLNYGLDRVMNWACKKARTPLIVHPLASWAWVFSALQQGSCLRLSLHPLWHPHPVILMWPLDPWTCLCHKVYFSWTAGLHTSGMAMVVGWTCVRFLIGCGKARSWELTAHAVWTNLSPDFV